MKRRSGPQLASPSPQIYWTATAAKNRRHDSEILSSHKGNYIGSMLVSIAPQIDDGIPTKFCPRCEKPKSYQG